MSSASKIPLRKILLKLIVPSNAKKAPDGYSYYPPRTYFSVDNVIFTNYFVSKFVQTFRTMGFWPEECGIWFAIFLPLKVIMDITVIVIRTLKLHRMAGKYVSFGKVLLSATYNFFMVSILNLSVTSLIWTYYYQKTTSPKTISSSLHIYYRKNKKSLLSRPLSSTNQRAYLSHSARNLPSLWTVDPKRENQLSPHDNFSRNRKVKKSLLQIALLETHGFNLV